MNIPKKDPLQNQNQPFNNLKLFQGIFESVSQSKVIQNCDLKLNHNPQNNCINAPETIENCEKQSSKQTTPSEINKNIFQNEQNKSIPYWLAIKHTINYRNIMKKVNNPSEKESNLSIQFVTDVLVNSKYKQFQYILMNEWQVDKNNLSKGKGDLVLTDGNDLLALELKYINKYYNQDVQLQKIKRVISQALYYAKVICYFKDNQKFENILLDKQFKNCQVLCGIFTNYDSDISIIQQNKQEQLLKYEQIIKSEKSKQVNFKRTFKQYQYNQKKFTLENNNQFKILLENIKKNINKAKSKEINIPDISLQIITEGQIENKLNAQNKVQQINEINIINTGQLQINNNFNTQNKFVYCITSESDSEDVIIINDVNIQKRQKKQNIKIIKNSTFRDENQQQNGVDYVEKYKQNQLVIEQNIEIKQLQEKQQIINNSVKNCELKLQYYNELIQKRFKDINFKQKYMQQLDLYASQKGYYSNNTTSNQSISLDQDNQKNKHSKYLIKKCLMNNLSTQDNLNQPLVINSDDSIDLSDEIKILKKPYYNLDLLKQNQKYIEID